MTLVACRICGLVQRVGALAPGAQAVCPRCGAVVVEHKVNTLGRTAAFSLAALMLYLPANIYPILQMELYGAHSENTVLDGCVALFAVIVFLASILIPFLKLLATPEDPRSPPAKDGTIFVLHDKPEKEWLSWLPKIPIPAATD